MQQALQREGIARLAPVENIPGAAGTIGLARFIGAERARGDVLMVSGLIMLGGIVTHQSPVTLRDVVPIARLTGEYEVIAVPAASPLRSLQDLMTAFKAQPGSISWGGGSAGGSDQILAGLVADAVGVDPKRVNYIAFSGGGESMSAILGGTVSVGINGFAEFAPQLEAGTLRALAISSAERLPGVDIPTLREQGVNVEFENWRSLVAPPGITPADRARLESVVRAMVQSPTWRESLARYRWLDRYLDGDALARFVDAEEARVRSILKKLGTGATTTSSIVPSGAYPRLVLVGLVLLGLAALLRAWRSETIIRRRLVRWCCAVSACGDRRRAASVSGRARRIRHCRHGAVLVHGARLRPSSSRTRRRGGAGDFAGVVRAVCPSAAAVAAMNTLELLREGFANALTWAHLGWAFAGVTLGTAVGVLPGIGPALTVALLLPITFTLDPISAFIMFGGIYYGAMYGGSTTSILLNTPGETASIATAIDGYAMARQGRGAAALTTAAIGSFVAGTLATIALTFFSPLLASVALRFGPAEYFALSIVAFAAVATLLGGSLLHGLFSLFLGLTLGLIGIDQLTGDARFSFGIPQLLDGIDVLILVIGLFAVGETLFQAWRYGRQEFEAVPVRGFIGMSREDWKRSWKPWLRGTAIGFPLGVLPVGGSVIPTFLSYTTEKRLSDRPEEFGHGAIEGVAGPEAANNAAAAGVLVPLLTLGLPSSATAAVLLAAFQQYGLQPGPLLFSSRPDLVWTLVASLYIGNVMLLVLNLPLVGIWTRVMLVPRPLLFGGILVLASLGAYSLNRSMLDLTLLYVVGAVGWLMRVYDIPLVPAVLGLVLGPLAELQFRRAVAISEGDLSVFVTRPISLAFLLVAVATLVGPWLVKRRR